MKRKQWIDREGCNTIPICINVPRHSFFDVISHNIRL